jgi:hypothetical protein
MSTARLAAPAARWRRAQAPLLVAAVVLLACVALHLRDPHHPGSWGFCPWLLLTGLDCPGCGGLRAVNDLTNGDLVGAASSNLMVVCAIPVAAVLWVRWLRAAWRGAPSRIGPRRAVAWCVLLVVVAVGFAVVRNLPVGAWLRA